jgi:hypothetical protein
MVDTTRIELVIRGGVKSPGLPVSLRAHRFSYRPTGSLQDGPAGRFPFIRAPHVSLSDVQAPSFYFHICSDPKARPPCIQLKTTRREHWTQSGFKTISPLTGFQFRESNLSRAGANDLTHNFPINALICVEATQIDAHSSLTCVDRSNGNFN